MSTGKNPEWVPETEPEHWPGDHGLSHPEAERMLNCTEHNEDGWVVLWTEEPTKTGQWIAIDRTDAIEWEAHR